MSYYEDFLDYAYEEHVYAERYDHFINTLEELALKALWKDRKGNIVKISSLDLGYLENILKMINSNSNYIMFHSIIADEINKRWE